jgi:hypothetical protein
MSAYHRRRRRQRIRVFDCMGSSILWRREQRGRRWNLDLPFVTSTAAAGSYWRLCDGRHGASRSSCRLAIPIILCILFTWSLISTSGSMCTHFLHTLLFYRMIVSSARRLDSVHGIGNCQSKATAARVLERGLIVHNRVPVREHIVIGGKLPCVFPPVFLLHFISVSSARPPELRRQAFPRFNARLRGTRRSYTHFIIVASVVQFYGCAM